MGVPAFFRWLSTKYPKIITPVIEERPVEVHGEEIPVDHTGPNPNGEEFDNLYLDMNGIVHPCSHPEDRPPPRDEEEMMLEIFKYTDRVVNMVRPRKVLMMAIDGVAPRAKMNQQRSRRFRSAKDAKEKDEEKEEFRRTMMSGKDKSGAGAEEPAEAVKTWDSNVITPGTPFMDTLAASLRYWVAYKLSTDPGWAHLKVIISDATVPGEGEHKIMEFVRSQRRSPDHDPNTRHVIYGLDADLIMLGLATHEPHFRVLREDVFFQSTKPNTCRLCGQAGHLAAECRGQAKVKEGEFDEKGKPVQKPFIWLKLNVLREYLAEELAVHRLPFKWDLERAIDDWVFMCFFVGNDFLPHLPSLSIREEGIDTLVACWKDNLPIMGGYVTKDGHVDLPRAQHILSGLAKQEDAIFKRRRQIDERREAGAKRRKLEADRRAGGNNNDRNNKGNGGDEGSSSWSGINPPVNPSYGKKGAQNHDDIPLFDPAQAKTEVRRLTHEQFVNKKAKFQESLAQSNVANKSAAAVLRETLLKKKASTSQLAEDSTADTETADPTPTGPGTPEATGALPTTPSTLGKRKADEVDEEEGTPGRNTPIVVGTPKPAESGEMAPDTVRLWEDGYADRYYEQKFQVDPKDIAFRHKVAAAYVEGCCWVLLYYMQGCPSWTWYYPYHYAPFAADFVDMADMKISFETGTPFRAYEQLMAVMPAASSHAIPEPFRELMMKEDSDILDFYPEDFPIDLNGKKFQWQGVALLPFIDEKRLLAAMGRKYPSLTPEERARNEFGKDVLLFSNRHPLYEDLVMKFYSKKRTESQLKLDPKRSHGLTGNVEKNEDHLPQSSLVSPLSGGSMPDLPEDQSMSVIYEMPQSKNIHKSMLLRGVNMPPPELNESDIQASRRRSQQSGRGYGGAPLHNNNNRNGGYGNNNGHGNNGGGRDQINYANPFAPFIAPGFNPANGQDGPPPPHVAAATGWVPPPPPQYAGGRGGQQPPVNYNPGFQAPGSQNWNQGGYGGGQGGYGGRSGQGQGGYGAQGQGPYGQNYDNRGQGRRDDRGGGDRRGGYGGGGRGGGDRGQDRGYNGRHRD